MNNLEEIRNLGSHTGMWPLKNGDALVPWLKNALQAQFGRVWDTIEVDSIQNAVGKRALWKAKLTRKVTAERNPFSGDLEPLFSPKTDTMTLDGEMVIEASFGHSMSATPVPQFSCYGRIYYRPR